MSSRESALSSLMRGCNPLPETVIKLTAGVAFAGGANELRKVFSEGSGGGAFSSRVRCLAIVRYPCVEIEVALTIKARTCLLWKVARGSRGAALCSSSTCGGPFVCAEKICQ